MEIYRTQNLNKLHSYDHTIYILKKIPFELTWWHEHINDCNGRSISEILGLDSWQSEVYTDASSYGCGATLFHAGKCLCKSGGQWLNREKQQHINIIEVWAIQFAFFAFRTFIAHCYARLHYDNTTAIFYSKTFGGCHNTLITYLNRKIWLWCIENKVSITAIHIPGIHNILADRLSRKVNDNSEWSLHITIF